MDLRMYVSKTVKIDLTINSYYYLGVVISADDNSITLRDKNGKIVTIKENSIAYIREVDT